MRDYIFIDSNLWLYAFIPTDKDKYDRTKTFLENCFKKDFVVISFQVINEVTFNLKKKKFSEERIKNIINAFSNSCVISNFSYQILLRASEIREKHKVSFWDSLIIASSIISNCKILYSEDMQSGMDIEGMKILNPLL